MLRIALNLTMFLLIVICSIFGVITIKKIRPERFKSYLIWVILIIFIAAFIYRPWMVFI